MTYQMEDVAAGRWTSHDSRAEEVEEGQGV
jgi:hypothetical protein